MSDNGKARQRRKRPGYCHYCGKKITVMIFRNDRYCSVNCEKLAKGEPIHEPATQ